MRRFLSRKFLIAYGVIAVLIGTGAFVMARRGSANVQYRTAPATLGTVTQTLSLSGNLAPVGETNLDFGGSGKVESVDVAAGQTVSSGTVLGTLDPSSLQNALTGAQATLASAQARLSLDQAGPTAQSLASAQGQVSTAQVSLQNDSTSLNDTRAANQQAVQQAQDTLQSAESTETSDCNANPSSSQCAQDKQAVQQDGDAVQAAQTKAQQSNDQAQEQVNSARVQLQNAQAALAALEQGTTSQQIQMDQSQVSIAQVGVSNAQTALDSATLTSPVDGVVAQVNVSAGETASSGSGSPTASSSSSTTHDFVIIAPGAFEVTGSVSDAEVNEIADGQQAQVVPAGSQEAITGQVTSIAEEATVSSGVATFPVTVTLSQNSPSLRAGMSATVNVVVNQVVQVVTVPTSAVHTTANGSTVTLLVNGAPQVRSVQVGASDALRTQILSGVSVGDQVVIATISSSVPTTSSGSGATGLFGGGGRAGLGGGGGAVRGGG